MKSTQFYSHIKMSRDLHLTLLLQMAWFGLVYCTLPCYPLYIKVTTMAATFTHFKKKQRDFLWPHGFPFIDWLLMIWTSSDTSEESISDKTKLFLCFWLFILTFLGSLCSKKLYSISKKRPLNSMSVMTQ